MTSDPLIDPDDDLESPPALGTVVEEGRGSLPFALIHGEALVAAAAWALGDAGITSVDLGVPWSGVVAAGDPFVLHDSLCPMTPASFLVTCLRTAVETDTVVVGVRPVTDTVKEVEDGLVGATIDRDELVAICSPIVLPASVVVALEALPSLDFPELVELLGARFPVSYVAAPASARRIGSREDLAVLEALTRG